MPITGGGTGNSPGMGGPVEVSNFPETQPVSGTLEVSNLPATQTVSGAVSISNFPATQPVSGTFFQATQPVSGTFFQTTQPVSGTVAVSNFPATQPVSGTVAVSNFPATQPVSGTFFQATQPVSGTFFQATQPVSGTFFQALQPVAPPTASLAVTATGIAAAAVTLTIPAAGAGLFHYITSIEITAYSTAARTGGVTPVLVTTTNLPGTPAFTFASAAAAGSTDRYLPNPAAPLRSAVANTATTIVCPNTTAIIWRVNVQYYTAA